MSNAHTRGRTGSELFKFRPGPNDTESVLTFSAEGSAKKIVDRVNAALSYVGVAAHGAATSAAVWSIRRELTQGAITTTDWVDEGAFTQVWDSRATLFTPGGFFNQLSTDFDGINDYIDFGDVYDYTSAQAFSISLWIKPQNFAALRYFASNVTNDANVYGWRLGIDTAGKIISQMRAAGFTHAADTWPTALTANTWLHVTWTYSGSGNKNGQKLYLNSVIEAFTPPTGLITGMSSGTSPLTLGKGPSNFFVGNMDEFAIWDKELTQTDVNEIYNAGVPLNLTTLAVAGNLKSWWRLGDGDTYPTALDQKGVANGTLTNMAAANFESDVP